MAAGGPGRARRKRGTGSTTVLLKASIPQHTYKTIDEAADELGISLGLYLEDLIERDRQARAASRSAEDPSAA